MPPLPVAPAWFPFADRNMTQNLRLPAALTLAEARATLAELGRQLEAAAEPVLDAQDLAELDSSALAVLLDCQRRLVRKGRTLRIVNAPPKLTQLARLYGVAELLGLDGTATGARTAAA